MAQDYRLGCKVGKYGYHRLKQTHLGPIRHQEKNEPQDVEMTCVHEGCGFIHQTTLYWGLAKRYFSVSPRKR